jgi:integrase
MSTPIVRLYKRSQKKDTWQIVIDYGNDPITKKRKKETKTITALDEEEAERQRKIIDGQIAAGKKTPTSKITVGEYFTNWLDTPAGKKLASKTVLRYRQCIELRIVPWIGHIKLIELSRKDLKDFYQVIIDKGRLDKVKDADGNWIPNPEPVGKETIVYHHRVIHRILDYAMREDELLEYNVSDRIDLPEPNVAYNDDEDLVRVFTVEQLQTLSKHLPDTPFQEIIEIDARTGLRRGELVALIDDDFDFEKKTLFIRRALSYTKEKGYEIKPTKNKKRRKIEITDETIFFAKQAIEKREAVKAKLEEKLGDKLKDIWHDLNLLFSRPDGHYMHPDTLTSWFPEFCDACGVPRLSFHCLRHTHASQLLATGEDISYVSKRLGHSDIMVTYAKYFHFIPEEKRKSLQDLEQKLKRRKTGENV